MGSHSVRGPAAECGAARLVPCLYLYPATGAEPRVLEIAPDTDLEAVEQSLHDCESGHFVEVPVTFPEPALCTEIPCTP